MTREEQFEEKKRFLGKCFTWIGAYCLTTIILLIVWMATVPNSTDHGWHIALLLLVSAMIMLRGCMLKMQTKEEQAETREIWNDVWTRFGIEDDVSTGRSAYDIADKYGLSSDDADYIFGWYMYHEPQFHPDHYPENYWEDKMRNDAERGNKKEAMRLMGWLDAKSTDLGLDTID